MPVATAAPPKPKGSTQALDLKNHGIEWEEIDVEVKLIDPRPDQPRKIFDEVKLEELASNINQFGLLQRILVERVEDRYQLIAGERRWRAFGLLKHKLIPARVIKATEEQKTLICLTENLLREDLTIFEEAEAYQATLKELGITQTALAKKLGCSQGQLSNQIRLLKLPPAIRTAIISREIDPSTGREIAAWCDLPAVYEALDKAVVESREYGEIDNEEMRAICHQVLKAHSRPMGVGHVEPGKPMRILTLPHTGEFDKRLQLRDVPTFVGGPTAQRAFNVELWNEMAVLVTSQFSETTKPQATSDTSNPAAASSATAAPDRGKTEVQLALEKQQQAQVKEERLKRYLLNWYWKVLAAWIPHCDTSFLWRLMCWFGTKEYFIDDRGTAEELTTIIEACGGKAVSMLDGELDLWASSATVTSPETFAAKLLSQWAANEYTSGFSTTETTHVLLQIVKELDITAAEHWECDLNFLQLHDLPELVALCLEWKRKGPGPSVTERDALIEWMLEENERKPFPAPKCLTKLKFKS